MRLALILASLFLFYSCSKVPISNRRQLHLLNESTLIDMASLQYSNFMDSVNVLGNSDPRAKRVVVIGNKIKNVAINFLSDNGYGHRVDGFKWEFITVDDPTLNAWCMPGGKVCFYTGLVDLADNDGQIAAVMGHEVAHAIAKHGNERMSQQLALAGIHDLSGLSDRENEEANSIFSMVFMGSSQLGMLKFSRVHETESDKMGLVFMKLAGYNPNEAIAFWEKMSSQGINIPEIISTHPSDERRIKDIKDFIDNELDNYVN